MEEKIKSTEEIWKENKEIAEKMFGFGIEVAFDKSIRGEKEEMEDLK